MAAGRGLCHYGGRRILREQDIIETHHWHVELLARRMLGGSDEVQDVVQEVFLAACRNLRSFRGDASLSTWLTIITINQCRTFRRKQSLRRYLLAEWQRQGSHTAPEAAEGLADPERSERVRQAVADLKGPLRDAIVLRYLQGLPTTEVAEVLGVSVPAAKVRLHRARARLRDMLAEIVE